MHFMKPLRQPIMRGEITCSIRVWQRPRVKVGGRYALGPGHVEVTSIREIGKKDITAALAKRSGFASIAGLMAVAQHGAGENIYLVEFQYHEQPPV